MGWLPPCNCRCQTFDPTLVDWNRQMIIVGPQTTDTTIAGYSTAWSFGGVLGPGGNHWRCQLPSATPDDTPVGTNGHWHRLMQPVRYVIDDATTLFVTLLQMSELATPTPALVAPIFKSPPTSDIGPPAAGHFTANTTNFSISVPFGAYANWASRARFIRVLVNGVDVSGAQSITIATNSQQHSNGWFNCPVSGATLSSPADVAGKTVAVDIWWEIDVTWLTSQVPPNNVAGQLTALWAFDETMAGRYANSVTAHYLHFIRGIGGLNTNAKGARVKDYAFTFSAPGITGGITFATTVTTAPWTVTRDNFRVRLLHSNANDTVELFYGQEIAEIIIKMRQTHTQFDTRNWWYRYVPANTGHYSAFSGVQPGVFDPNASQTYNLIGFSTDNISFNPNVSSVTGVWCPATITVAPL